MAIYTIQPHPNTPSIADFNVDRAFGGVLSWSNSDELTDEYRQIINGLCGIGEPLKSTKMFGTDGTEILCYIAETPASTAPEAHWTEYIEGLAAEDTRHDAMFRDMLKNLGVARIYVQDAPGTSPRIIGATR